MNAERVKKYYELFQEIKNKRELTSLEFNVLIRNRKCSVSIINILLDGGLMVKENKTYKWVSPVLTVATAVKALGELKMRNRKYNENKKRIIREKETAPVLMNEADIHEQIVDTTPAEDFSPRPNSDRDLLERQFLDTMPKIKRKYKKKAKREFSILWGLISYKTY